MYDWVKKWAVIFTTYLNIITQASRWPTIKGHLTLSEKSINSERPRPIHFWPRLNLKSGTCAWRKKPPPGEEGLDHLVPGQVGEAQPIKGRRWRQGTAAASSWGWLVVFCIQAVSKKDFLNWPKPSSYPHFFVNARGEVIEREKEGFGQFRKSLLLGHPLYHIWLNRTE